MVADDSESIRVLLRDVIAMGKHELVAEAVDGQDTIDKFNKFKPDVLLLDLAMPKKDGITVLREIMPKNPELKVIVVTANGTEKIISECMDAGATDYVAKPFQPNEILEKITN